MIFLMEKPTLILQKHSMVGSILRWCWCHKFSWNIQQDIHLVAAVTFGNGDIGHDRFEKLEAEGRFPLENDHLGRENRLQRASIHYNRLVTIATRLRENESGYKKQNF